MPDQESSNSRTGISGRSAIAEATVAREAIDGLSTAVAEARRSGVDVLADDLRRISEEAREAGIRAAGAEARAGEALDQKQAAEQRAARAQAAAEALRKIRSR